MEDAGGQLRLAMPNRLKVIPIASGKGGVGKSVLAANLSIALARMGHKTVAVDLDLGGSNLHTYLGLPNRNPGIGDYLKNGSGSLAALQVETGVPNLKFIPGDGKTPFMANLDSQRRFKLMQELLAIDAQYLVADLGAGSSLNTMNFFGMSHEGIIVTTFELPALMNFIFFLKSFMLANMTSLVRGNRAVHDLIRQACRQPRANGGFTTDALIRRIGEHDARLADQIRERCAPYRPRIIMNMGEHPDDLAVLDKVDATLRKSIGMEADYCGFIYYDETVRRSLRKSQALLNRFPDCPYASCIAAIAGKIASGHRHDSGIEALRREVISGHSRRSANA